MEIAYAAHTESCTFMLDANGVCRWVVASNASAQPQSKAWEKSQQAAARCVGAQYVASLDVTTKGGLLEMPREGIPMLFARVDPATGRVTLVRTAAILRFEIKNAEAETSEVPVAEDTHDSGMRERPQAPDSDSDMWEVETRPMRRDEIWHDVEPDPESGEDDWDLDTATAKVQLHPVALERMRPPSNGGSGPRERDVYTSAPPTTHMGNPDTRPPPAYSMPVPKTAYAHHAPRTPLPARPPAPAPAAPLPPFRARAPQTLPPPPTNKRPTIPPPMGQYNHARPQGTPLPPPPGYSMPRTPVPTPPPRRATYEEPPPRRATYEELPPPRPVRIAGGSAWTDARPTIRRAR